MPSSDQFVSFSDLWAPGTNLGGGHPWTHTRILTHGAVSLKQDWVAHWMSDPQWRLYCNLDAGACVHTGHGVLALEPLQLYVLPAWLNWHGSVEGKVRHMHFGVDIPQFSMQQARTNWNNVYQVTDGDAIVKAWCEICFSWQGGREQSAADYCRWYQLMYQIMELFFEQQPPQQRQLPQELRDVTDYIEQHLGAELNNEELAEVALCSSGHLIRTFKRLLGQTPAQYVRERRLTAAAHRLAYGDDSIEQIAEELGFPNRYYLTRVFTKMMGYSPARYRKLF